MVSTSDCGSEDAGSIPAGHIIYTMGIMTPKKYGAILRYRKGHTKQPVPYDAMNGLDKRNIPNIAGLNKQNKNGSYNNIYGNNHHVGPDNCKFCLKKKGK